MMHRLASGRTAVALGGAMLLLIAAGPPLLAVTHQLTFQNALGLPLLLAPFAAVGVVVARRQPRNPIGWILLALALAMMFSADVGGYAVLAFRQGHPGLPLARLAVALTQTWIALVLLLPLPILLFPDGRLPSPRWRWSFYLYLSLAALLVVKIAVNDAPAFTDRHVSVDSSGELTHLGNSGGGATVIPIVLYVLVVLSWVVGKILEYRRSVGERREQLKWLMAGGSVSFVTLMITLQFVGSIAFLGVAALPLAIGVGILKYRLYEIDRLISRTLAYAIVTGLLVALFVGMGGLTTDVLPFSSPVGVAASTLAAVGLFNPLRRRVQHLVDRRFNRARYDAEATVADFAARLRGAVELETIEAGLLDAVNRAVEPAHLTIWARQTS